MGVSKTWRKKMLIREEYEFRNDNLGRYWIIWTWCTVNTSGNPKFECCDGYYCVAVRFENA